MFCYRDYWLECRLGVPVHCLQSNGVIIRDVPDIRFRFLLAGYPAIFFYPVPAPVPAEMVPGTGYLYRIVLGRFRQLVDPVYCVMRV